MLSDGVPWYEFNGGRKRGRCFTARDIFSSPFPSSYHRPLCPLSVLFSIRHHGVVYEAVHPPRSQLILLEPQ